jgi:hypothetical protein
MREERMSLFKQFIGPSKRADERVMQAAGTHR